MKEDKFKVWIDEAVANGLLDMKFAVDTHAVSCREVIDSFADAKTAIKAGLVHNGPPPSSGEANRDVLELLASA
jgi:uncharacterized protein YggU (UPF0235/DUF167 family)